MESTVQSEEVRLSIPGKLPSWNEILGMEYRKRDQFKKRIQATFLCALRASADASSMKTISARNIMSTAADTLDSYQATQREKRASKRASRKLTAMMKSASKSQSVS